MVIVEESELYPVAKQHFKEKGVSFSGNAKTRRIQLPGIGGDRVPDIYGIENPAAKDFKIYIVEGKSKHRRND